MGIDEIVHSLRRNMQDFVNQQQGWRVQGQGARVLRQGLAMHSPGGNEGSSMSEDEVSPGLRLGAQGFGFEWLVGARLRGFGV